MTTYKNLSGNSGVVTYEFGADFIDVTFVQGSTYTYNYDATGASDVEAMKRLAEAGAGLGSYISQHVGKRYASKR